MFTGTYTAIVTPFRAGKFDSEAMQKLVELQVRGGVDGIVVHAIGGERRQF